MKDRNGRGVSKMGQTGYDKDSEIRLVERQGRLAEGGSTLSGLNKKTPKNLGIMAMEIL